MRFDRTDVFRFFGYSFVFSVFFAGYNIAFSPFFETTFDSSSIYNQEVKAEEPVIVKNKNIPLQSAPQSLVISFNPEYVDIDPSIVERIKENVDSSYFKSKVTPLDLVIDTKRQEPRGQVLGNKLILSASVNDDSESIKVLVHELGHVVDIFYLKKHTFSSDPSDKFYDIAWDSFNVKKKNLKIANFVSGYALSNKYEDFAESFAFYVFHNEVFADLAKTDSVLKRKYDFFKTYVFDQDEFVGTSFQVARLAPYNWDTTKIPINTKKYLYYIR